MARFLFSLLMGTIGTVLCKDTDPTNPEAIKGPYSVAMETFDLPDSNSKDEYMDKITVWYPTGMCDSEANGHKATYSDMDKFPFVSYAHGMFGGGAVEVPAYNALLETLSSFGYIIGATHQCSLGCFDDCVSLKGDPPCFGRYYTKQLDVINFAKEGSLVPFKAIGL